MKQLSAFTPEAELLDDFACKHPIDTQLRMAWLQGWPLPAATEVWVLPSTSGAAAMTVEERVGPYREMAARLAAVPWPVMQATCQNVKSEDLREEARAS